jgi:hypothetical protein
VSEVYFHCSDAEHVIFDRRGAAMNLTEAREHAERLVRSFLTMPGAEDWRVWALYVTDDLGEEVFVLPFASVLGKPH